MPLAGDGAIRVATSIKEPCIGQLCLKCRLGSKVPAVFAKRSSIDARPDDLVIFISLLFMTGRNLGRVLACLSVKAKVVQIEGERPYDAEM